MARDSLFVVVYDVTDDGERERVADLLAGFGFRVQKSVFECRLTRSALGLLQTRMEALALVSGHVAFYRADARARRVRIGPAPDGESLGWRPSHALVV